MIITLCGSGRFEAWFHAWNEVLGLAGHASFGLCVWPSMKKGEKNWYTDEQKKCLDEVHFQKIAASDAVLVLNPFAYIGNSTLGEITHATRLKKKIFMLESWGAGNGVGSNHTNSYRAKAKAFGVYPSRSPIDTFNYSYAYDLLGPGGASRDAAVASLEGLDGG